MDHLEIELLKLYNTLATIETKGDSTKTMADCLRFVEQLRANVVESGKDQNTTTDNQETE